MSFGHWLRQRRRALDLTQIALARQVGCAAVTIRKIEGEELRPSKELAELLADQLGVAPEDREAFLVFARGGRQADRLVSSTANPQVPWLELQPRLTNLPTPLTSFVGRTHELVEVKDLLKARRLVTLTGPGGIGKTRLASLVAGELLGAFPDGVWLVELASLTDSTQILQAVAMSMEIREVTGQPLLHTLTDRIRSKQTLLILDNCEHLILACAQLAETMLGACPNLTILATSREAFAIPGETIFSVPPLSLPQGSIVPGTELYPRLDLLDHSEAVRLFVERAKPVQPAFELTNENVASVAHICQRVDGIPLAIELAAARLKTITVEQVEARLDDRFNLLKAGSRTALPRHQTLQATIDWSYELLSEPERTQLRRLSVFAGGWTLEAAEAICGNGMEQEAIESRDVLDLLSSLVDKSLVVFNRVIAEGRGVEERYRLLETIRQYADEKLLDTAEREKVRARHFDWFLRLAERAEIDLHGPDEVKWLDQLEIEHDNMLAALDWSVQSQSQGEQASIPEQGLELGALLWWFWRVRGSPREGRERLTALLGRTGSTHTSLIRAKALYGAGALAFTQGDYETAQAFYDESLAISGVAGGKRERVFALNGLGAISQVRGDYPRSHSFYGEAVTLSREIGFDWGLAISLLNIGVLRMDQSDYGLAQLFFEESLANFRRLGDKAGVAPSLMNLGMIRYFQGDYRGAYTLYEESLEVYRDLRDELRAAYITDSLAYIELHEGNYDRASELFVESLVLFREFGNMQLVADVLEGLAGLAAAEQRPVDAARLFGASQALLEEIGAQLESGNRDEHERNVSVARGQLDESAFAAAWGEGRGLSVEQAIQNALTLKDRSTERNYAKEEL